MKYLLATFLLMLSSLSFAQAPTVDTPATPPIHKLGVDGYYIERITMSRYEFLLHIHAAKDQDELYKFYQDVFGHGAPVGLKGFSLIHPKGGDCQVYIVDPKVSYEPEYLGHEITHCIYGFFHNSQHRTSSGAPGHTTPMVNITVKADKIPLATHRISK